MGRFWSEADINFGWSPQRIYGEDAAVSFKTFADHHLWRAETFRLENPPIFIGQAA